VSERRAVLFVRVEPLLVEGLDRIAREETKARRGTETSRSDVVRTLLWEAIRERDRARREAKRQE
jgi:hypothetical protein